MKIEWLIGCIYSVCLSSLLPQPVPKGLPAQQKPDLNETPTTQPSVSDSHLAELQDKIHQTEATNKVRQNWLQSSSILSLCYSPGDGCWGIPSSLQNGSFRSIVLYFCLYFLSYMCELHVSWQICMCVCACVYQRSVSGIVPQEVSTLRYFWRPSFTRTQGLSQANQSSICSHIPRARIISTKLQAWLFMWLLGIKIRSSQLAQPFSLSYQEFSLSHTYHIF